MSSAALPYHEPGIITILIQSSILILLNAVNYVLDRILYCGLVGQIFIGIAFGTPGAKWLGEEAEHVIVQLGYLGLILIVYEGGLSTSFPSLKANFTLSSAVALTGIAVPIGFSFILQRLASASPLQSFAAGAALCSTSLGTTFTILGTSGLTNTRLGTVLTSAAMMDDVIGLVMVQVISNLGGNSDFDAITVVRPVFVSIGFGVICLLACRFLVLPLTVRLNRLRDTNSRGWLQKPCVRNEAALVFHTLLLVAMVTAATYAGSSSLFAAYLAGATVSWWDSEVPHFTHQPRRVETSNAVIHENKEGEGVTLQNEMEDSSSGVVVYNNFFVKPVNGILKPLFFASIGFSIPITRMFDGDVVWRGIIYTILMCLGKLACGLWLLRFSVAMPGKIHPRRLKGLASFIAGQLRCIGRSRQASAPAAEQPFSMVKIGNGQASTRVAPAPTSLVPRTTPVSLYPASILGLAMVARGEIGFLISSLAESKGIFGEVNGEVFLVVTWAIVLCTVLGPVGVGLLVRRLKRLEKEKNINGSGRDVLGVWGVGTG
ncbi:hypothetical protein EJ08DRAFT_589257 [Tothia fuscella]|uniref:Cation/H+ exchanger transmembrane domain-containing protein n=1 Tax=Tothia fuscella TaxID=1048955 RepID=A0A9P4TY88_9PEZI|nr:hypothetical protein EJ08DRAFT_589257 [Tothia fuscella]